VVRNEIGQICSDIGDNFTPNSYFFRYHKNNKTDPNDFDCEHPGRKPSDRRIGENEDRFCFWKCPE
jgi:hypothetical protein